MTEKISDPFTRGYRISLSTPPHVGPRGGSSFAGVNRTLSWVTRFEPGCWHVTGTQLQLPRPSPSAEAVDDSEVVAPLAAGDDDAVNQAEAPTPAAGDGAEKQAQAAGFVVVHHMEWAEIVIAFCLASAIDIALLSVQGHSLPALFHLFSLAILLAFASVVVSKFINPKFLVTAQVLEKCGVFFTVTAFFIAISILPQNR
ncbi:hypothetical protein SO802_030545 [Lithocarpus litseifolius]|uniref:GDT1 family protein n=1 Tax=Lithocarpus litseifolius TaxID=425828 RepID=A0AAW2BLA7_9ROSI